MSSCERRRALRALAGAGAFGLLTGCGFRPVYGRRGETEAALGGGVRVAAPPGRAGHHFARALRARLGPEGGGAASRLSAELAFSRRETVITVEEDVTRYDLIGAARYRLTDAGGALIGAGEVDAVSGYNTLAAPYAARRAADAAERRVAEELAALVFLEIAALLAAGGRRDA